MSRETFVRASHESCDILASVSRLCVRLTTVVRHSRECLTTFVRISISFIFSQLSLEMALFMSQTICICIAYLSQVQIAETKLRCVCEGLATGSRHMR